MPLRMSKGPSPSALNEAEACMREKQLALDLIEAYVNDRTWV